MVLVEESVLLLQRIFTSVTQVLASVPHKTNQLIYLQLHECSHQDPTRKKLRVLHIWTRLADNFRSVCYTWTRYTWKKSKLNQPEDREHPLCAGQLIPCPIFPKIPNIPHDWMCEELSTPTF